MESDLEEALDNLWIDIGNYSLRNRCMNDPEFLRRHQYLQDMGFVIGDISHPYSFSFDEGVDPRKKLEAFDCDDMTAGMVINAMAHAIMNIQQHAIINELPYGVWLYRVYQDDDRRGVFEFYTMDRGPGVPLEDDPERIAKILEPDVSFGTLSEQRIGLGIIEWGSDFLRIESNGYAYDTQTREIEKVNLPVEHGFRLKVIKYLTPEDKH